MAVLSGAGGCIGPARLSSRESYDPLSGLGREQAALCLEAGAAALGMDAGRLFLPLKDLLSCLGEAVCLPALLSLGDYRLAGERAFFEGRDMEAACMTLPEARELSLLLARLREGRTGTGGESLYAALSPGTVTTLALHTPLWTAMALEELERLRMEGAPLFVALDGREGRRDKTQNAVLLELQTHVRKSLCGFAEAGELSMLDLERQRGGRVVFLQYDLTAGGAADSCYGLLVDLYLTGLMSGRHRRGRLYLALDEIALLGRETPEALLRALNFGRGIGLGGVFIGAQSLAQLEGMFGKEQLGALLAGCQTRLCFRTEDETSRAFVKESCGRLLCSTAQYIPGFSLTTGAPELKDAVSDTDLMTLPTGRAVVSEPEGIPYMIQLDGE